MNNNLVKVYAAFHSGCLGKNILEAYYPFFANIIYEERWDIVDEDLVAKIFADKYHFNVPLPFIRQVLGVGIEKKAIVRSKGNYVVNKDLLQADRFHSSEFDKKWRAMVDGFQKYCKKNEIDLKPFNVEERLMSSIDRDDETIILEGACVAPDDSDVFDYAWGSYVSNLAENRPEDFDFIVSLSLCNIMKQAAFYTGDAKGSFEGLNIYLDSPMVFALLDMDSQSRARSCKLLINKMIDSKCIVQIFDHNLSEIEGIISRAAGWASSVNYDISKANNIAKFFRDKEMSEQEISEYCISLRDKLSQLKILIKTTDYDVYEHQFQEDENKIYMMIEQKFREQNQEISKERNSSIRIDVRSIIMVYRARRGQLSAHIQSSREIMLTLNGTIANVSKAYASSLNTAASHIPACISADLFGTVLWLFSPVDLMEYHRKQLLADCYIAMKPTKAMLNKYVESLEAARNAGELDDAKFYFMRSHSVVNDALMNVTKGDYARFTSQTYIDVYNEIEARAEKRYRNEAEEHALTRNELTSLQDERQTDQKIITDLTMKVEELSQQLKNKNKRDFEKKRDLWGAVLTLVLLGVPFLLTYGGIEIVKSQFTSLNFSTTIIVGALIVVLFIVGILFKKAKNWCYFIAGNWLQRHE